jgi:hypothetical protein
MAQEVEYLPSNREALSFNFHITKRKENDILLYTVDLLSKLE